MAETETADVTDEPVRSLSHYTNLAGLVGIVEHRQLWASNVAFLNDKEELVHGIKCARTALARILADRKLAQWKDAIRYGLNEISEGGMPNTYAACFCERSDLLSQWREYGGHEQGVCLTFDRKGLSALQKGKRSFLAPVQYGLISGKTHLRQSLRDHLLSIGIEDLVAMGDAEKRAKVYDVLSDLIPRFKHLGFKAELEWRLVVQHTTLRAELKFRANRNVVVPYVELGGQTPLPLKSVRIGPGNDADLTRRSIEQFLKAKGYDVPVRLSRVPFRS